MSLFLAPLRPTFEAAIRDVTATEGRMRLLAAERLGDLRDAPGDEARTRAVDGLVVLAKDKEREVRVQALTSLARLRDERAIEVVLERFADDEPTVREAAVIAAGELGGERAREALRKAVNDTRPEVRFQAVAAYGVVAGEDARTAIAVALGDDDALVRLSALEAISMLDPTDDARTRVARLLRDPAPEVVEEAALTLAALGDRRSIPHLKPLLSGPRLFEAMQFAGDLAAVELADELAKIADSLLKPLLVKAAAAVALVRIGDGRGAGAFRAVFDAWRNDARTYCVDAIAELRLPGFTTELGRMIERPRGAQPRSVVRALVRLASADDEARAIVDRLVERQDVIGALARELHAAEHGESHRAD